MREGNSFALKHGKSFSKVYRTWQGIKGRCTNKKNKDYLKYSKMGIDKSWLDFDTFFKDMGEPPTDSHSIDRINNSKGYYPSNCRWATRFQQCRNKSNNRKLEVDGELLTLSEIAERYDLKYSTLYNRVTKGTWNTDEIINNPVKNGGFYRWRNK